MDWLQGRSARYASEVAEIRKSGRAVLVKHFTDNMRREFSSGEVVSVADSAIETLVADGVIRALKEQKNGIRRLS